MEQKNLGLFDSGWLLPRQPVSLMYGADTAFDLWETRLQAKKRTLSGVRLVRRRSGLLQNTRKNGYSMVV
ncbi:hypothetical protein SDC9_153040 [bioreactor metagenome]|uniref:Uncharacterized protein n=1 Tax=bioreactor metagenome TaxID=1076179 RepID=A0A645EVB7_9ZZZZ